MEDFEKVVSASLPIIYLIKSGGEANIDELSQVLYGWDVRFRTTKCVDRFIRNNIRCFDYDGFNIKYNSFSKSFVKGEKLDSSVKSFLEGYLKDYNYWNLYTFSES